MQADFRPKQIYEQVADRIRAGILDGRYAQGSRLPSERDLAQLLGVSRPAVREAIGALQDEGLVVTRQGSGTYVADTLECRSNVPPLPPRDQMADLELSLISALEVRMLIEPAIARLAARRAQRDPIAEQYLDEMSDVKDITDPLYQASWNKSARLFHRQLAQMTGNPLITKIAEEINGVMAQAQWTRPNPGKISGLERTRLYLAERQLIYEAIVTGDEDAAAFYVEGHLKRIERDMSHVE
ncbi:MULTISPECIES: FadR/GntR family transcriptional regulator [Pseudomonas]|uniref:FadR/GntR family transcriptional regulator n=1 Tax=Pseudomonas TaxID=286 RepID=UPI00035D5A3E|nr:MULTISPECIES: FadR/GntR family transcriptional regulator [Pseudomonas]AYN98092.1 FadR family transcriptional regulator [Pseudomonas sp. LTGT-11-2Z]MDH0572750.1 FadR family transcriptional regulator [Pseudomonas fulva]PIK78814.1 FadR family transcriptional regulator [Pseudomonas sp. 382]